MRNLTKNLILTLLGISLSLGAFGNSATSAPAEPPKNVVCKIGLEFLDVPVMPDYIKTWNASIKEKMLFNVSPYMDPLDSSKGFYKGAVIAAQSFGWDPKKPVFGESPLHPNYKFHWIRDAGITWTMLVDLYLESNDPAEKNRLLQMDMDVLAFLKKLQLEQNRLGSFGVKGQGNDMQYYLNYGLAKYQLDGTPVDGWMDPQNDGWAYVLKGAFHLLSHVWDNWNDLFDRDSPVRTNFQRSDLYNHEGTLESNKSIIKTALEFLAHSVGKVDNQGHIISPPADSYDMWEEEYGLHFATLGAQQAVLLVEAPEFANRAGDPGAAQFYAKVGHDLDTFLMKFWDPQRKVIIPSMHWDESARDLKPGIQDSRSNPAKDGAPKRSGINTQVLIGLDHMKSPTFSPASDYALSTMYQTEMAFKKLYKINAGQKVVLLGRDPEDIYAGGNEQGGWRGPGRPWFISTFYAASLAYKAGTELYSRGEISINSLNVDYFNYVLDQVGNKERVQIGQVFKTNDPMFTTIISSQVRRGDMIMDYTLNHFAGRRTDPVPTAFGKYLGKSAGNRDGSQGLSDAMGLLSEQITADANGEEGLAAQRSAPSLTWSYASYFRAVKSRKIFMEYVTQNNPGLNSFLIVAPRNNPAAAATGSGK